MCAHHIIIQSLCGEIWGQEAQSLEQIYIYFKCEARKKIWNSVFFKKTFLPLFADIHCFFNMFWLNFCDILHFLDKVILKTSTSAFCLMFYKQNVLT